jgi:predicted RNA binding protein YcfA (HicA-like mRNA interferase family)
MRLPRDTGGEELASRLKAYGYAVTRQTGSHMRLTTLRGGEHHVTIPRHVSMRLGTLHSVLRDVAEHFDLPREVLVQRLFGSD